MWYFLFTRRHSNLGATYTWRYFFFALNLAPSQLDFFPGAVIRTFTVYACISIYGGVLVSEVLAVLLLGSGEGSVHEPLPVAVLSVAAAHRRVEAHTP